MKRSDFYSSDRAESELRMARAFRCAYRASHAFDSNPALLGLFRRWMREHAQQAVKHARAAKCS